MDQRNLILAIVLSLTILLSYEIFIGGPQRQALLEQSETVQTGETTPLPDAEIPTPPTGETTPGAAAENLGAMVKEELQGVLRSTKTAVEGVALPLAGTPEVDEARAVAGAVGLCGGSGPAAAGLCGGWALRRLRPRGGQAPRRSGPT